MAVQKKQTQRGGEKKAKEEGRAGFLKVDYIRSGHFRVVYASGFMIGVNPTGEIHLSAWSEHPAYPSEGGIGVEPDGTLTGEVRNTGGAFLQREVEVGIILRQDVARALLQLLQDQMNQIEVLDGASRKPE